MYALGAHFLERLRVQLKKPKSKKRVAIEGPPPPSPVSRRFGFCRNSPNERAE